MNIGEISKKYEQYVIEKRRDFHRHPELSKQEKRTSKIVQEELKRMGISYETVAGYNVIGWLGKGKSGRSIAIRADMDALLLKERTGISFASEAEGVMHACGHDATDHCVVSTGHISAGTMGNIFPSCAVIEGSCRYFKQGGENKIIEKMEQLVAGVAAAYGAVCV